MHPPLHDHLLMGALVAGARVAALRLSVAQVTSAAERLAELALGLRGGAQVGEEAGEQAGEQAEDPRRVADEAAVLAHRVSRIVPGANCLHRAAAARVWLATRGQRGRIAIGLRKRGGLEGHAWLEIDTGDGPISLFVSEADGYRRLWTTRSR